jgi:putative transposase
MCKVLKLARSEYYAWCKRKLSPRNQENEILSEQIKQIHESSRQTYGSPRIQAALVARGFKVGRQRVVRLMAKLGICARLKRKFKATTDSKHNLPIAKNILDRNFTTTEPDRSWVADITYIWTAQGWLYLAVIIGQFSRRVVGWSMAEHMRTDLILTALEAALGQRIPSASGLVFHSDRGSEYASSDYQLALQNAGITCSMSRRANCDVPRTILFGNRLPAQRRPQNNVKHWDNAVAESFFGTLKIELIHPIIFSTREVARTIIAEWIEVFYNRQRLHSTIGYLSPVHFEDNYWSTLEQPKTA